MFTYTLLQCDIPVYTAALNPGVLFCLFQTYHLMIAVVDLLHAARCAEPPAQALAKAIINQRMETGRRQQPQAKSREGEPVLVRTNYP